MSTLVAIFLIGGLIFVHELGHLLAAAAVGIPVARFSLGFGPVLARRKIKGVEYCLSAIPLGGYVLPQVEDEEDLLRFAVWRRIVMWLGGPAANLAAAWLLLAWLGYLSRGATWDALVLQPSEQFVRTTLGFLAALPQVFSRPDQLSGIVGIVAAGQSVVAEGLASGLKFAVILNLNLAIFNLLPIAPLDGGKIVCSLAELIHPRLARLHNGLAVAGLVLLGGLLLYTTALDVVRQIT